MHLRLPLTLWRHTLLDLLKLLVLTTTVLVMVITLGAAVKPLSDGVLQPQDLLKFIAIACVPMLAHALPFAGGFAATIVYYRIAHENEAVAAHAGGISHRTLLAPAFLIAILLTGTILALNQQIIPAFLRQVQKLITIDVARQIIRGVEKGEAIQLKGASSGSVESRIMIYADAAAALTPEKGTGATDKVQLHKFAAVEFGKDGQPVTEITAENATLWLYPGSTSSESGDSRSQVFMRLENMVALWPGKFDGNTRDSFDLVFTVPNAFNDRVSFLSYSELRDLQNAPERISWVRTNFERLVYTLAERQTIASMQKAIDSGDAIVFADGHHPVSVRAGSIKGEPGRWELGPVPGGSVTADLIRGSTSGESSATITAQRAILLNDPTSGPRRLDFHIDFERARLRVGDTGDAAAQTERAVVSITGLNPLPNPAEPLLDLSSPQLLAKAAQWTLESPGDNLDGAPSSVAKVVGQIKRIVLSQQNQRLAMAVSCAVMVLTGAMTALLLSRRLPLTVYLWTFFPAIASLVTISGGAQATSAQGAPGLFLMWSGVGGLALYSLVVFRWLARH